VTSPGEVDYAGRTDSVEDKLTFLRAALEAGSYELAMALADSIKDSITLERQLHGNPGAPVVPASAVHDTSSLPIPWREWARGWSEYQVIVVAETAGLERRHEPVDILVSVPAARTARLAREARLARIDRETGAMREIPSQIYGELQRGDERLGRLVFFATVPAHAQETYLLFSGNSEAELPNYPTDLRVGGEGYGLDVDTTYYTASLSRQMGQIERLTYKRGHGLELFAGGEGHGEPPNIDWAHDYLASNHFQKFRVTNWAACPNYEVVRGPLCVQLRRWGFPHSPVHPLFAPSRMHIDVTYTFYANTPYFLKQGRMEMIQDFSLNYLRDDEWVFSGYSFTDSLWMGDDGRLREGEVPSEHQDNLWGVGFYHRDSRDAFIALHLEHDAEGFSGPLYHSGPPVLDYTGHGQLWSRWAAHDDPFFPAGSVLKQRNAYLVLPYTREEGATTAERYWQHLRAPLTAYAGDLPNTPSSRIAQRLARPGEDGNSPIRKQDIWEELRACRDEMLYTIDANVVDMGYIHDVQVHGQIVRILMTMPHRGRPRYDYLAEPIRQRVGKLPGVDQVIVDLTWDPHWSANDLTDPGAASLGLPPRDVHQ